MHASLYKQARFVQCTARPCTTSWLRRARVPNLAAVWTLEIPSKIPAAFAAFSVATAVARLRGRGDAAAVPAETVGVKSPFTEDIRRPDNGILHVGPSLASKLRASLKSKAITDGLVYFNMKNRSAPIAICSAIAARSASSNSGCLESPPCAQMQSAHPLDRQP